MSANNRSATNNNTPVLFTDADPVIVTAGRYIVTYDLPCEHRTIFEGNAAAIKAVANLRYGCGQRLHSLGLQATQSQIFVAPDQNSHIAPTKEFIMNSYRALQIRLEQSIPDIRLNPLVVISPLEGAVQLGQFTFLVQQALMNKIDEAFMRVNATIDAIENSELSTAQIHRLHYRLPADAGEFREIQRQAEQFGIDTSNVRALIDLLTQAHSRTG
jgi:hypothetical protein